MFKRKLLGLVYALTVLVLLSGCVPTISTPEAPRKESTSTPAAVAETNVSKAPATRRITVRIDPTQSPPSAVAIYAEIPGGGENSQILGETYFLVEGDGSADLVLDLPAAGYLIYGYSLDFEDLSYFGAWGAAGGLDFIDGATASEVVLQRPLNPCTVDYQLLGSPDGRFLPTSEPAILQRFGC